MKLSDVMSAMNLTAYAEVALILFLLAFVMVAISLLRHGERETWERARQLPLALDDERAPARKDATRGAR
jgi:cbb3-type cytochrome oxidase subunit 3